ncbi:Cytochrome oxidase biogenesis protein Cox11-CtaG, copper delivery to Cox1 [Marinobacterium lacunae]|uniref:Cytochrome c oxidase assembly protein CtaG n=1 Tax=Marinobacterium lacunae TaxID=1232683 RepID=A0A081FWR0_9GAMM|nr:cytochrome c oxidase assembly protein [Marinobacterium lacunae]KEA62965.1 Cytochrome oxidase biogenesis protein Cox11-CtaG, copper delivery to Cox1 [Marinobacterium lacunae]MBR9883754.1 cytochrome c oxidase assembly protein [Oceanospirillales bacterium]
MDTARANRRLIVRLLLASVLMFGFGFALVPLYDVFCKVTGLNGRITATGPADAEGVDTARQVKVRLIGINNEGMPWKFGPQESLLEVNPGEMKQTAFLASNPTAQRMVAQAIPSVSPGEAAQYLHKINCFCFNSQTLAAGEGVEMPLLFMIDTDLPESIHSITLSYTLFDISPDNTGTAQADTQEGGSPI